MTLDYNFGQAYASVTSTHMRPAATQAATASSPTVSEFLNAANAEYVISGPPAGMRPFTVGGHQVSYTNVLDGVSAKVWITAENQVLIAYQGTTGGDNFILDPIIVGPQLIDDILSAAGANSPAEADSLSFARSVVNQAAAAGYAASNVFVTGHSLGGIEAEYVASQTGLAGVAFEPTGLPAADITGSGSNFVNIVEYGDPVGSYASDVAGEQPFGPAYVAGGGKVPHYGNIVMIGSATDQTTLSHDMAAWGKSIIADAGVLLDWAGLLLAHHLPGVQAHDLGVTLSPYTKISDDTGNMTAPVWNVAGDTISQLLSDAAGRGVLMHG